MSSIGTPGSATYAITLTGIEEMLSVLPNNTANEIDAQKVRNVVYTLYEDIQDGATEFRYTNPDQITNPIGNWVKGVNDWGGTFSNVGLKELFDGIFYKDVDGSASLAFEPVPPIQEFKQINTPGYPYNTSFDELITFQLRWTARKGTHALKTTGKIERTPVPTIAVDGIDGNPLFVIGVPSAGGSDKTPFIKPILNQTNEYTFTCFDIKNKTYTSPKISVRYGVKWYWGKVPNQNPLSSDQIRALDGASVAGSGEFAEGFNRSFNGINGMGQYLCWAFPSSWGTPRLIVNSFPNNAITKIQNKFKYVNIYGYEFEYDVWVTNTPQNSPIASFQMFK